MLEGKRTYLMLGALGLYWLGARLGWWPASEEITGGLALLAVTFLRASIADLKSQIAHPKPE